MLHDVRLTGHRYMLRPVEVADAAFIVGLRSDPHLGKFIHESSPRVQDQEAWIERYFQAPGDWYFIVADRVSGSREGTIGIYDHDAAQGTAEWGRWIIRPGSLASIESALLIYRAAFEALALSALYCRTVADNKRVVSFHDSSRAPRRAVLRDYVEIGGRSFDSIEHYVDAAAWQAMEPRFNQLAARLAERTGG